MFNKRAQNICVTGVMLCNRFVSISGWSRHKWIYVARKVRLKKQWASGKPTGKELSGTAETIMLPNNTHLTPPWTDNWILSWPDAGSCKKPRPTRRKAHTFSFDWTSRDFLLARTCKWLETCRRVKQKRRKRKRGKRETEAVTIEKRWAGVLYTYLYTCLILSHLLPC